MKQTFSLIYKCRSTDRALSWRQHAYSDGLCPHCGNIEPGTFTHAEKVVIETFTPSLWERLTGHREVVIERGDDDE